MQVICPKCGQEIEVKMQKGDGAAYAKDMKKLSMMSFNILEWWLKHPNWWMTGLEAYHTFYDEMKKNQNASPAVLGYKVKSFTARVSELVGLGLLSMTVDIRKLQDPETMSIRHPRKPRYKIANLGLVTEVIRRNGYVHWIGNETLDMRSQLTSESKPEFW